MASRSIQRTKNHGCEYCQKKFHSKSHLAAHRKIHLMKTDFQCPLCEYVTNFKHTLTIHVRTHKNEKPFKCLHPNCTAAFKQSSNLKMHQITHKREKKPLSILKCPICPYDTFIKRNFNRHMVAHTAPKHFSCDFCPYRTSIKASFKSHMDRMHPTEVKPLLCIQPGCQYFSNCRNDLRMHLRVHSDERPFCCPVQHCQYKSKRKEDLKKHLKVHGGGRMSRRSKYSPNEFCPCLVSRSQDFSSDAAGSGKIGCSGRKGPGNFASQFSHVKWSVDWGRIEIQKDGRVKNRIRDSGCDFAKVVIKVEKCWLCP